MEHAQKNYLALAALIVGVSIVVGTGIVAFTMYNIRALSNVISVTGSADKLVKSDTVKWVSGFSRNVSADGLRSGSTDMKRDLEIIRAYFIAAGIPESDISVQPVATSPICESQQNVFYDKLGNQNCNRTIGYFMRQEVIIQSSDVDKVTKLTQEASDALIEKDVLFSSHNVEYYYNKLSDLRIEMLSEATENAKARAEKIAESTGAAIGFLQSATMGVFQVTAKNSIDFSDYGFYDTNSIEKKVTAVVRVSFSLK